LSFLKEEKNVKQWRQAYKQHQLSFDNIRKKHIKLLFMMDIKKISKKFFLVFICGCFLEKQFDVKFPDDEDFYHIIWGFNQ